MQERPVGRGIRRDLNANPVRPEIDSLELLLLAGRKSPKTVRTHTEAARWLAAAHLLPAGIRDWEAVCAKHIQRWTTGLAARY